MNDLDASMAALDLAVQLDPARALPLYEQLAEQIRQAIDNGVLPPGSMLPPEPALAARLGVSRQTVNQALTKLARRGVLTRRRGAGTFVAEPFVEQPLGGLYSFLRTLTAQGRLPGTRLLGYRLTVEEQASMLLTGRTDGLVLEISRLRLVDGDPFVVETIYLPESCAGRLAADELDRATVYELLERHCEVAVTHAEETLRPVTLDRPEAALLGLAVGEPAFLVERTGFAGERPVELRVSLIRGDRYRFRVRLERPMLSAPLD